MSNYSSLAKFYDNSMGDMSWKINFLHKLLQQSAPKAKTILEFACGTGTIIQGLSANYNMAGVDLSPKMAKIARQKLPKTDIRVGDMATYDFGKTFDAVLCICDSVNHLQTWEQWVAFFANAHKHLAGGGVLIFDLLPPKRYEWSANHAGSSWEIGNDYLFMKTRSDKGGFALDIRYFKKASDGRFTLYKESIHEVTFPIDQVKKELAKLFVVEKIVDAQNHDQNDPFWRPYIVCRKK